MKNLKKHPLTLVVLALILLVPHTNVVAQQTARNQKLHQLFDAYHEEHLALDPIMATILGESKYNDVFIVDDEAHLKKVHDFNTKYLDQLGEFDPDDLTKEDRISYLILKGKLESSLRLEKYHLEYVPINQAGSIHLGFALWGAGSGAQPFNTVEDYRNWLKRITGFVHWTEVAIDNMREGIKAGMVLPRANVLKMIPQLENLSKSDSNSMFYGLVKNFPDSFSQKEKDRLVNDYRKAIDEEVTPSYQKLLVFLKEEYLPHSRSTSGIHALPNGEALYRELVYRYTSSHKTAEEIHQIGLAEVGRITAEMEKIKTGINFQGSLLDLFEYMKTGQDFMPFKTRDEVIQHYHKIHDKIKPFLADYFSIFPETAFEIRETEAFRATSAAPAEYHPGDIKTNRPGIFYVPIVDPTKINTTQFEMESLFIHEAVPGHHFQWSLQLENDNLPKFRQSSVETAFREGWALYCESLGKQLGVLTNPYSQLGALGGEIHRAIRLVVDTGIHTGKMTREEAIDYMLQHEPISESAAISEAERYMVWPGQALSYKSGELKIKELRDRYQKQLGDAFNLRDFHDTILQGGAMPLDILEIYMDDWAAGL